MLLALQLLWMLLPGSLLSPLYSMDLALKTNAPMSTPILGNSKVASSFCVPWSSLLCFQGSLNSVFRTSAPLNEASKDCLPSLVTRKGVTPAPILARLGGYIGLLFLPPCTPSYFYVSWLPSNLSITFSLVWEAETLAVLDPS